MRALLRVSVATAMALAASGCGDRAAAPAPGAGSASPAPPALASAATLAAAAATETPATTEASAPTPAAPVSSDPDNPIPLPTLSLKGAGSGVAETRYWRFDAGAGTITVTATAKNQPSGATEALQFGLYDARANRLCFDALGNTTADKTVELKCSIDKDMPVLLRLDLSAESLDYTVTLAGPANLPKPAEAAATGAVAGAGSTDIDAPTILASNRVKADGPGKPVSWYYAFNAGPGELTLTGDGRNTSAAVTEALRLGLYTLRSERICEQTLDKRVVTTCTLERREPVILRADLSAQTVEFRARFDGAYDFEPYTPPKVITIALDSSVMFDTGKSAIKPEARQALHEAAERIRKFADAAIVISGHTDNVGSEASNRKLSGERAAAVEAYFTGEEGIASDRLKTQGFGASQPVADNGTDAGRARNRRVDVAITPKGAH